MARCLLHNSLSRAASFVYFSHSLSLFFSVSKCAAFFQLFPAVPLNPLLSSSLLCLPLFSSSPASPDVAAVQTVSEQVQSADNSQPLAVRVSDELPVSLPPSDTG